MEQRSVLTATPPAEYQNASHLLFPALETDLSKMVQLIMTIVNTVMFSFIFILASVQLCMIWYYRHKRLSYQTLFLLMSLIWSGLRTTLFSSYHKVCQKDSNLSITFNWIVYRLPVCLQFTMLCLLLHFFVQIVLKATTRIEPQQRKFPLHLFIGTSVLLFMAINVACAAMTRQYALKCVSVPPYMIYIHVALTETMFFVYGIFLSIAFYKMTQIASMPRVLEAQGTTVCKAFRAAILITVLFLSRTIYILVSICSGSMTGTPHYGFDLIVTTQVDPVSKWSSGLAYVLFSIVLFILEVLPISVVVIFFRVKRLSAGQVLTDFSTQNSGSRVFFFDNDNCSDSESDQTRQPEPDYLDSISPQTYVHSTHQSLTPGRAPVAAAVPHQQISSSRRDSALPSSSLQVKNKGGTNYGAVHSKGLPQSRTQTVHSSTKK